MKIYMIGMGKMGYNLALNMREHGYDVIAFDVSDEIMAKAAHDGFRTITSLHAIGEDKDVKIIWVMLPAGRITNETLMDLANYATSGDMIVDGGNSDYHDSVRNGELLGAKGVFFFDVGTSGGVYGARHGASFMAGGDAEKFEELKPLLEAIAAEDGLLYTGKTGSGHYLKIIHNAILHSELEILGEGFELLQACPFEYDLKDVAYGWSKSAVIRGWLMDLMFDAFNKNETLDNVETTIHSSGACATAIKSALDVNVPVPMMEVTQVMRQGTQQRDSFNARVINSLRKEIGGYRPSK